MKISVVTASYNYQDYIKETIQSVLDQTYNDWELIIVDDCSTDNSVDVIKSFNDERIKLFINEKNLGLAQTVKRGVEYATGEWIVFLESDDLITPDNIEKKVQIIKKYSDLNLIFNDCEFFGDKNKVKDFSIALKKTRILLKNKNYPTKMFYNFYLSNKIFTFSSVMAKREDLLNISYNPPIDSLLDWWLWVQLAYIGNFYYIPEKLTKWRLHKNSYIESSNNISLNKIHNEMYYRMFKKYKKIKILIFIPFAQIIWGLQQAKKFLTKLIFNKRK
ncbi:glycosyl transferase family 2 family protein [Clostridium sp. CAG:768]|nr:glycosyl transferase family 2 family protein [Clostridium sp. CAG:768]